MNDYRECSIMHVDMDAFYASVAVRDNPQFRGRPLIVGHVGGRGVVLSATYEARALGVRSAMPVSAAQRLAPQAIVVPPTHDKYAEVSSAVMEIFHDVTPLVEPLSLDEAFLDVSGAYRMFGAPRTIGQQIRTRVERELGITCSVGISINKLMAKLASTMAKPDGMLVVPEQVIIDFLHPLPVSRLWGVGETTAHALQRLGIATIGDLAHVPVTTVQHAVGEVQGRTLAELAWGRDSRPVVVNAPEKSVGAEITFARDINDLEVIGAELLRLSNQVARRLRRGGISARTLTLKLRFEDFTTITRSKTLSDATDIGHQIYEVVHDLLNRLNLQRVRIRLVGVRATGLLGTGLGRPAALFDDVYDDWSAVERVTDEAMERFGDDAVMVARLLPPEGTTGIS